MSVLLFTGKIIRTKIGIVKQNIYGRQCTIKPIKNDEYKQFCELNHIQGYCIAKVRLGLYHNEELVQIMSFIKPRFNKKYDWENIRTCTLLNTVVVGGFSKILKHFKNNYSGSIISYVDVRYFNGNEYQNNGFKLYEHSNPNYFYFKNSTNKIIYVNEDKIEQILDKYDYNLTIHNNMLNNKYLRIFDAGYLVMGLI